MSRIVKIIVAVNLIALAVLVFVYPQLMVAPGKLIPSHAKLEADCFACHKPLLGADPGRCIACHKPGDIGRLTTAGLPIVMPHRSTPFHQALVSQDCMACHSDHAGVNRFQMQAFFHHALLKKAVREQCQACHASPTDSLHSQITGNCLQCHTQEKWVPTTFAHNKSFTLDSNHNVSCVTCHLLNDYSRYTCYGCHEHSPSGIRDVHIEKDIRNFQNCVECHRGTGEHDIGEGHGVEREERD